MNECIRSTIELVNQAREVLDLEPIDDLKKGSRGDALNCPITKSLGGNVSVTADEVFLRPPNQNLTQEIADKWEVNVQGYDWGRDKLPAPTPIEEFVKRFDMGEFDRYEKQPSESTEE